MSIPSGRDFINQVSVSGVPVYAEFDYTDPSVAAEYYQQIQVLNEIMNRSSATPPVTLTAADVANVNAALAALQTLATNGLQANSTANIVPPVVTMKTYYLTTQMATNLDLLYRTFSAVGATGTSPPTVTLPQLKQWKDLSTVSTTIQDVLQAATYAAASNRSLQSLIELEYVKTGSDLIGEKLSGLNDALTVSNNVLNSLANLQDIRNRMVVNQPVGYVFPTSIMIDPNSDGKSGIHAADIMSAYRGKASQYFNATIVPQVSPSLISGGATTATGDATYAQLLAIQKSLLAFIPALSAVIGSAGLADSNSLYNRIKKISQDFTDMFQNGGIAAASLTTATDKAKAMQTYLLDNNVSAFKVTGHSTGDGQSDLSFGITAGQALNDTQKEDVRRFLNVFEEYYKSAASILQRISQMIEKMAQNISR
jgi:hypothetical protein